MPHTVSTTRLPDLLRQVGVVVMPGFSLLAHACATEPLHVANLLHGRTLYRLTSYASGGDAVTSASQQTVLPRAALGEAESQPDMVLVCGPAKLPGGIPDDLAAWLRRLAASGVVLGGIGGGTEALARLGLLDGYQATLPWQRFEAFAAAHPRVRLSQQLFEIDRDRITCGGGTAAMDMMITLVESHHGPGLATRISEYFVMERIRMGDEPQQIPLRSRLAHAPDSLVEAVQLMEANIEEPLSTHELAEHLGISRRQLERLFKKYLKSVPSRYYLDLRLQKARRMLRDTDQPAGEIALQTGFSSAAHFSTAYRNHFGMTPREERLG
ncbi:GlxA family transcriptional regulator [Halomonas sp. DP5N14-9]|uniref:GlxA family transcriptional regulator n=1 Tax=Halomonas sp. H10-59 TaxID=2950874 RepID=A0AAU7KWJ9_9GAMM|nr:GlxA family transcriptional regulator [Halomonas sp. DP5N14-9]MBY5939957.1 GlxA family transcriptional regulator [Halomonas sp. DP5N14-9]